MKHQQPSNGSSKHIFVGLIFLTVVYQVLFHTVFSRKLKEDDLENRCMPSGGKAGDASNQPALDSPECVEFQLFHRWRDESLGADKLLDNVEEVALASAEEDQEPSRKRVAMIDAAGEALEQPGVLPESSRIAATGSIANLSDVSGKPLWQPATLFEQYFGQATLAGVHQEAEELAGFATAASKTHQNATLGVGPPEVSSATSLRGGLRLLHWSDVTSWPTFTTPLHGTPSVFTKEQFWNMKWAEPKLPKAACITGITSGHAAKNRLKYFINSFRLQDYEGPRELVLVYHHSDREAAQLIRKYADGATDIRGVAAGPEGPSGAHSGNAGVVGAFPTAAALRYGAWTAHDAEVVGHWVFEEWHHPQRLSMQIKALAAARRPGSILKQWTVREDSGLNSGVMSAGLGWEGSLVGEKKWMHKHWFPFLAEGKSLFDDGKDLHITQVDVPELSVYNGGAEGLEGIVHHFGLKSEDEEA